MALNVTTAVFAENCNTATASPSLAQWDTEQVLQISGIDLPDSYKVEFSTVFTRNAIPAIGDASGVAIPNVLLQRSAPITAYIVLYGENGGRNREYWITIYITPGQPPETITPDPEQADVIDEAIATLNNGVARTEAAATSAEGSARDAEAAAEAVQNLSVAAETLATGEPATVEKAVDEETGAVTLNFGLPRGAKGDPLTYEELTPEQKAELVQGPILEAQNAAVTAVGNARVSAVDAVESAGTTQVNAVNQAGANQVAAVNQAGTNQVQAVEDKGAEVLDSIPQDYSDLVDDVAGLSRQLNDETTGLNSKAPVILETASGAIASFADGADGMPVKKLVAKIEPVQDLHGYDSPWPAGGGKNLLEVTLSSRTSSGVIFTVGEDGTISCKNNATETVSLVVAKWTGTSGTEYVLNGCPSGGENSSKYKLDYNNRPLVIDTGSGIEFSASGEEGNVRIVIYEGYGDGLVFKPMIRLATEADSTFAPYSNICPISGWTGAEIEQAGVNVWDEEWEVGSIDATTGQNTNSTSIIRAKNYTQVKSGESYYFSVGTVVNSVWLCYYKINKDFISASAISPNTVFTIPEECGFIRFRMLTAYGTTYNNDISINYPATDTTYHPYTGDQISVTFPTEAGDSGTVYGGTLDAITGKLTVTWARESKTWGSLVFIEDLNTVKRKRFNLSIPANGDQAIRLTAFCNVAPYNGDTALDSTHFSIFSSGASAQVWLPLNTSDDTQVEICYVIATPIEYTLTANELTTLYGQNNIWADTGDVEIEYPADTKLFIEKLTQPTEDDMTADHAISAGTFFQLGNTLYLATAAIAAGATITPGTNATKLSLADALNTLNS